MSRPACYRVVASGTLAPALVIEDLGPWNSHLTITNDAERVVESLLAAGTLLPGQRLFYFDTERQLDELLVREGRFAGFAPGPVPRT